MGGAVVDVVDVCRGLVGFRGWGDTVRKRGRTHHGHGAGPVCHGMCVMYVVRGGFCCGQPSAGSALLAI